VKYYECFEFEGDLCVGMEFIDGTNLREFISEKQKFNDNFEHSFILNIFSQIFNPLKYCKTQNIIHKNIKPENIIISSEKDCKLVDFGFQKAIGNVIT
jgi:serine/threonine protein kinase